MKATFKHSVQWSDWSEHSPSHSGAIPCAVMLPDGERIGLEPWDTAQYMHGSEGSRGGYVQIHPNVRVREKFWEDGSARYGRAGSTMEVIAPKGSAFIFSRGCPWCGEKAGECTEDELVHGKAPLLWHEKCKAENDEQERLIEEHLAYVREQERLADEAWEREYGHLLG